jgi:septal ring factor EnvC (AmiA/AmiB activator)
MLNMDETVIEQLKDHETRIREIEKNSIEVKYNLLSLENGLKDIKIMVNEILNKLVNVTIDNSKVDTEIKKNNNQKFWEVLFKIGAILSPIITGLVVYFQK